MRSCRKNETPIAEMRGMRRGAAQRPVGDPLDGDRQQRARGHAGPEHGRSTSGQGRLSSTPGALEAEEDLDADEGAQDEDLRVREVDELEHPVDHRVAERDQRA